MPADDWYIDSLGIRAAHELSLGKSITVAVLDSGVGAHPDIDKNTLPGISYTPGENDGRSDARGHGTAIAGIIAGTGAPPQGILGIAPAAKILPVKIFSSAADSNSDNLARGIMWAVDNGAQIINISAGGGPNPGVRSAVQVALDNDLIVVASVGNKPEASIIQFPAYIDGVVAIGSTDRDGLVSNFSISGDRVALTAPGSEIRTTKPGATYTIGTGTSASAAIVSGVAALVWSRYPELSAVEVVHRMTATAVDKGAPGRDPEYGFGIVDPVAALTADVPPLAASAEPGRSEEAGPAEPNTMGQVAVVLVAVIASLLGVGLVVALLVFRLRGRRSDADISQGDET
nr:type VII secretion-associated serine protease mycosin [Catenuloplanes japonicus]